MDHANQAGTMDTPTRIAFLAVCPRDAALLELMMQRFLRDEFIIVARDEADMAIVDGDAADGIRTLASWQEMRPLAPTVVLSLQTGVNSASVTYVRKPINIHNLIDMLSELRPYARRLAPAVVFRQSFDRPPETPGLAYPAYAPGADAAGPVVVGDDESNKVVSVEICMSSDLDEIFSASDICGPGLQPGSLQGGAREIAASAVQRSKLFRGILDRLEAPAGR